MMDYQGRDPIADPDLTEKGDEALYVEFYVKPTVNYLKSLEAKAPVYEDKEYIRIIMDNGASELDRPLVSGVDKFGASVSDPYILRFKRKYDAFKAGKSAKEFGTPLSLLFPFGPGKCKNYERNEIYSIEQLAASADTVIQACGMGAMQDRELARVYIEKATSGMGLALDAKEMDGIRKENVSLKEAMAELNSKLEVLMRSQDKKKSKNEE